MEKIFEQIDNLFVNGVINGIISIVIAGIVLIAINKLLNKFIKKKWPDNYVLQKRIKKIILITIFLAIICSEVKFLKSFATALPISRMFTCLSYALKIKFAPRLHRSVNMWRRLCPRLLHLRTCSSRVPNFLKELSITKIARNTQQLRAILHSIHPSIRSQAYPDCNPVRLFRHSPRHASS